MKLKAEKLWDKKLLTYQFVFVLIVVVISFVITKLPSYLTKPRPIKDLQLNVNTATKEELISVPYIGEKTAEKILKIRDEKEGLKDLKELQNLRYYKKFKYFLKVE